jgi:voltage-gated potassium channel
MSALRGKVHQVLEAETTALPLGRAVNYALIALIVGNVVALVLGSEAAIAARYGDWLRAFEWFSVALFTLEYAARLWAAVEGPRHRRPVLGRLRYMLTPLALVDLVAILPFYLGFLLPFDLLFMRVFRLVLIFKLSRYQASMSLLGRVLRNEAGPIAAAVFVLGMLLVVAASFAWLAEHDAQPEVFADILDALWWAVVTMTTVGYGDMVPVTPLGKLIGGIIAVIGLGMVALPAGLLASGFSEQLHHRRREFESEIERVLASGGITPAEGDHLKDLRDRLGLTDRQAAEIMRLIIARHGHQGRCPHCGQALTPLPDSG